MAISTYAELQQAVADNLARSDLTSFIPDFVTMAENWLNYGSDDVEPLRCREMEAVTSLTPTAGVCTLPTDYIEYRRVTEETSTPAAGLHHERHGRGALSAREGGLSGHFTSSGAACTPSRCRPTISNWSTTRALPPLASNSTNWLLTKAPGVYLRAVLVQAAEFIKDTRKRQAGVHGKGADCRHEPFRHDGPLCSRRADPRGVTPD